MDLPCKNYHSTIYPNDDFRFPSFLLYYDLKCFCKKELSFLIYILMHYSLIYLHQGRLIDIYLFFGYDPKASFILAVKSLGLSLVSIQYTHIFPSILIPRWLQLNMFSLSILWSEKWHFFPKEKTIILKENSSFESLKMVAILSSLNAFRHSTVRYKCYVWG